MLQLDPILSKEARRKSDTGIANPCLRKLVNDIASLGYGRGKISSTTALHPATSFGKRRPFTMSRCNFASVTIEGTLSPIL